MKEDLKIGDVEFEVKSVRWQYDVSLLDSCRAVLHAFLQIAEQTPGSSPVKVFAKTIKKWKVLILKVLESFKKTSEKVVVEREVCLSLFFFFFPLLVLVSHTNHA